MALTPGTRLGVYEVTAQIGEGGMGQVYRATDTRLKRQVAIKILPPSLASDQERLARFQREAEVLASLNHPNIAAIYGLEESGGITALVMELVEGPTRTSRFTFDPRSDGFPFWSPDGTRIVFRSMRTGVGDLYQKLASGAGVEERLVASDSQTKFPTSWSSDGRFLLYLSIDGQTNYDLWVVPMAGDRTPSVLLKTRVAESWGAFSPNGRWVAYQSNESGRLEVYVRPFVPPLVPDSAAGTAAGATGGQRLVSTAGGVFPVWRPDGKELYYLNPEAAMMATPITVTGATLTPGAPVVLFPTRIVGGGVPSTQGLQYDVAPDGRFLINTVLDSATAPITLLQNWNPEAKK